MLDRMQNDAIPILHVANAQQGIKWYERLGYVKEWEELGAVDPPSKTDCVCLPSTKVLDAWSVLFAVFRTRAH
jgi:hypothetical protein